MNACDTTREQLQDYLDGELPQEEGAVVASHLASCQACRAEAAALGELFARLDAPAIPAAPARLKGAVMAHVARARRRRRLLQTATLAAGVLLAVGIAGMAAWQGVDDAVTAELAGWQFDDVWQSVTESASAFGAEMLDSEVAWPTTLASGPMLAALALAFILVDVLLLVRWRGLAMSDAGKTRTLR